MVHAEMQMESQENAEPQPKLPDSKTYTPETHIADS